MEGVSLRQAAKSIGISRVTVKRYWDGGVMPGDRALSLKAEPPEDEIDSAASLKGAIRQLMEEEAGVFTRKQKLNAATIFRYLSGEFHTSERTVRRIVREIEFELGMDIVDMTLEFEPGEAIQMDWCEVKVIVKGIPYKKPIFCAVSPYSFHIVVKLFPNMTFESFVDAHNEVVREFGGVPLMFLYDNLKTAVYKGSGKDAITQKEFKLLQAHYQFDARFTNAAKGNEKGSVENLCKICERNFLVPIIRANSFLEVQEIIDARVMNYNNNHKIKGKNESIKELYDIDKQHLNPLPKTEYEKFKTKLVNVNDSSIFHFETNKYSVPEQYARRQVTIVTHYQSIDVKYKGITIAQHIRSFGNNEKILNPYHFPRALAAKPRSIDHSAALKNWVFEPPIVEFIKHVDKKDKYKILARLVILQCQLNEKIVLDAVLKANSNSKYTIADVEKYINKINNIKIPKDTALEVDVKLPDLKFYDPIITKDDN
jgi:hypothetical protein